MSKSKKKSSVSKSVPTRSASTAWYSKPFVIVFAFVLVAVIIVGVSVANRSAKDAETAAQPQVSSAAEAAATAAPASETSSTKQKNNGYSKAPAMSIDQNKKYTARIETTLGTIEVELLPKVAPKTVNNFVFLSRDGYYNDILFHRVVKNFMIQTGDPLGSGTGGPGYQFEDELNSGISYDPGVVAMANAGPNTNGSQFFICSGADCKNLDNMPNYSIFGKVIKGMEIVDAIQNVEVDYGPGGELSSPKSPVSMKKVTITESE